MHYLESLFIKGTKILKDVLTQKKLVTAFIKSIIPKHESKISSNDNFNRPFNENTERPKKLNTALIKILNKKRSQWLPSIK